MGSVNIPGYTKAMMTIFRLKINDNLRKRKLICNNHLLCIVWSNHVGRPYTARVPSGGTQANW